MRHKFWVFIYCCQEGIPWRGLVHDNSKFLPSEWFPYVNYFYGKGNDIKRGRDESGYYKPTDTGDADFDFAWLLHQKRNKHHWQWWVLPDDDGGDKIIEMPAKYRKEMICDWKGAGKAQGTPDIRNWYAKHKHKLRIHLSTRELIEERIGFNG